MKLTYSTSEAKTQLSKVLKRVREGETVTVTYRGEPVAEIRPTLQKSGKPDPKKTKTIEDRLEDLRRSGVLVSPGLPRQPIKPVANWPGAVEWLLTERDD